MSDIKKILVPVDFSESSEPALARAASIAAQCGAALSILHVWDALDFLPSAERSPEVARNMMTLTEYSEQRARAELEAFVAGARARGITVAASDARAGVPSRTIVEVAKDESFDLVVMGTHGRTGLAHALLGSVAERVVRHAFIPVLTVRADAPEPASPIRRILAPVDYSDSSRLALEYAADLATALGAVIDAVHVWDRPPYVSREVVVNLPQGGHRPLGELIHENAEREMQDFLSTLDRPVPADKLQSRLLSGEPASTLLSELEKGGHQLVVLGTRGQGGIKHLLLGSFAEKLVRLSKVPVLTVPPPNRLLHSAP